MQSENNQFSELVMFLLENNLFSLLFLHKQMAVEKQAEVHQKRAYTRVICVPRDVTFSESLEKFKRAVC